MQSFNKDKKTGSSKTLLSKKRSSYSINMQKLENMDAAFATITNLELQMNALQKEIEKIGGFSILG